MPNVDPLHPEWDDDERAAGDAARDEGISNAARGTPPGWRMMADAAVLYVAKRRPEFTTDAVWYVLDSWDVPVPPEPRAMGPVMQAAEAAGWCEVITGKVHRTIRRSRHRAPIWVYRSNVYQPPKAAVAAV